MNTGRTEIADRLFVIVDIATVLAGASLDVVVRRHRLDDRPGKMGILDQALAFFDICSPPDFACRYVIERSDNASGTGLSDLFERDCIAGLRPADNVAGSCG